MRKIDADAFNKKIIAKIKELDFLVKNISPENVSYFDAELIEAAENYTKVIKDCTWTDNSNFNGIEAHKITDLLDHLKVFKSKLYVERSVVVCQKDDDTKFTLNHQIEIPDKFNGRQSMLIPRITYEFENGGGVYSKSLDSALTMSHSIKYMVYKKTNEIVVDFEMEVSDSFSDIIWLNFLLLTWRY